MQFGLLLALAIALGVQSSTVQRFGVSGLSTTYLTGTLTSAVIHLVAHRTARGSERHWNIIGALVLGATAAAGMHEVAGPALPVPQLVGLAARARLRRPGDPPGGPRYRGTRYVRCVTSSFCRADTGSRSTSATPAAFSPARSQHPPVRPRGPSPNRRVSTSAPDRNQARLALLAGSGPRRAE